MRLTILVTKSYRLLSLAAVVDMFETANHFLQQEGQSPMFELEFVGMDAQETLPENLRHLPYSAVGVSSTKSDLVVVPAFATEDMQHTIACNKSFIPFLKSQYTQGATLLSLCTGAFLLGASGLLDGKTATTHIEAAMHFTTAFPKVNLQPHAIITESGNIYTSGGATSGFHLKLYLIQKYCGRELALRVAKNFAIDMDRTNQLYFDQFKPALAQDALVRQVQLFIDQRYDRIKSVEEAMAEVPSSRRNLIRRFKLATGITPIRYLQKTKIEAAKNLLETTHKDILDVMLSSGYNDMKNFRKLFKTFTGLTPKGYREKYGMR